MQVSEIRDAIEIKLRDQNNQILTDAQILSLLNEAQREWATHTEEIVQLGGMAATALQFDYAAPADLLKLKQAWWIPLSGFELDVKNDYEWSEHGGMDRRNGGYPFMARQFRDGSSQRLQFWPPPTSSSAATQLNGGIDDVVTTVVVDDLSTFRAPMGYFKVDNEIILYQNVSGTTNFLLCKRGALGTTAASHLDNAAVTQIDILFSYSRTPAALSGDTSVPELLPSNHSDLQWYVLYHGLLLDGRPDSSAGYQALWERAKQNGRKLAWRQQAASPARRTGSPYGP